MLDDLVADVADWADHAARVRLDLRGRLDDDGRVGAIAGLKQRELELRLVELLALAVELPPHGS